MHRNSQKRIITDDAIYSTTTVTKNRIPFFAKPILCDLLIAELQLCKQVKGFDLYAFVSCLIISTLCYTLTRE